MRTEVRKITNLSEEKITIECVEITSQIREILVFLQSNGKEITGMSDGTMTRVMVADIFYFEAVDEHVFACTKDKVYEIKQKLYEVEEKYREIKFLRISKSIVVNLRKISTITPALNARYTANLKNGEQLIVSRQYVRALKEVLLGGGGGRR